MICISLIGMTPGIICRNFFPFPNFPFKPDEFQIFSESTVLLTSRLFELTPETSELLFFMKKKLESSTLCWVGRYVYAPEPVHGRQGGYIGAGVWTLDSVIDPSVSIELLRHLCARVGRLMSSYERLNRDFSNFDWDEVQADDYLVQRARGSLVRIEWSSTVQKLTAGMACYIDANSGYQNYDMLALLNLAQTSEDLLQYERIYITNSRKTALSDGKSPSIKLIRVSDLPEEVRNTLVVDSFERAATPLMSVTSPSEARTESQFNKDADSAKRPATLAGSHANGFDKALTNRLIALEREYGSLSEVVKQRWEYQNTLQIAIVAAAATSFLGIIISCVALTASLNPSASQEVHDRNAATTEPSTAKSEEPAAEKTAKQSDAYSGALYLKQKEVLTRSLSGDVKGLSNLADLFQSQECQKFIPPSNTFPDKNIPGAIACFKKISAAYTKLQAISDSLNEAVKTLP